MFIVTLQMYKAQAKITVTEVVALKDIFLYDSRLKSNSRFIVIVTETTYKQHFVHGSCIV